MKYYKKKIPSKWEVFAFEEDGSQDKYITSDLIEISQEDAKRIAASVPKDNLTLDMIRGASTKRNWNWPPKSYQEAIGQIVVNSSKVEVTLRTVIWHIADLDSISGRAFTGKMRIHELMETLKALIQHKKPDLLGDVTQICSQIREAFKKRAIFVHHVWTIKDGQPAVGKLFLERYERLESLQLVTLEEMYSLANTLNDIQGELISKVVI